MLATFAILTATSTVAAGIDRAEMLIRDTACRAKVRRQPEGTCTIVTGPPEHVGIVVARFDVGHAGGGWRDVFDIAADGVNLPDRFTP